MEIFQSQPSGVMAKSLALGMASAVNAVTLGVLHMVISKMNHMTTPPHMWSCACIEGMCTDIFQAQPSSAKVEQMALGMASLVGYVILLCCTWSSANESLDHSSLHVYMYMYRGDVAQKYSSHSPLVSWLSSWLWAWHLQWALSLWVCCTWSPANESQDFDSQKQQLF